MVDAAPSAPRPRAAQDSEADDTHLRKLSPRPSAATAALRASPRTASRERFPARAQRTQSEPRGDCLRRRGIDRRRAAVGGQLLSGRALIGFPPQGRGRGGPRCLGAGLSSRGRSASRSPLGFEGRPPADRALRAPPAPPLSSATRTPGPQPRPLRGGFQATAQLSGARAEPTRSRACCVTRAAPAPHPHPRPVRAPRRRRGNERVPSLERSEQCLGGYSLYNLMMSLFLKNILY